MAFTSVKNDSGLMPEGEYECYVKDCRETETQKGVPIIKFEFVVRGDLEQPCKGKHIFKNFYQDDAGVFPAKKIGQYANALGIPDGEPFELEDLIGRSCVVRMKHFIGRDDGIERECIFFTKPSKERPYLNSVVSFAAPSTIGGSQNQDFAELDEDDGDLPF